MPARFSLYEADWETNLSFNRFVKPALVALDGRSGSWVDEYLLIPLSHAILKNNRIASSKTRNSERASTYEITSVEFTSCAYRRMLRLIRLTLSGDAFADLKQATRHAHACNWEHQSKQIQLLKRRVEGIEKNFELTLRSLVG